MKRTLTLILLIGLLSAMDVRLIEPVDVNGDGAIVSNCPLQQVRLLAYDWDDITGDMILFTFCGLIYDSSFTEMSISGDTLLFAPIALPWTFYCGRDSIDFHIATYFPDSFRWFADTQFTGHFILDAQKPHITEVYPHGLLSSPTLYAGFEAEDDHCISLLPHLTMIAGGDTLSISSFTIPIDETMDTVWMFASVSDNCADYCEPHFSDTSWFFVVSDTASVSYSLSAGWNLVGWPGSEPLNATMLEGIIPPVFQYSSGEYLEASELESGKGYWLLLPRDTVFTFEVSEHDLSIPITSGWNLIGGMGAEASSITDLEAVLPPVYTYDTDLRAYTETDSLSPLKGYWILATESDTLE